MGMVIKNFARSSRTLFFLQPYGLYNSRPTFQHLCVLPVTTERTFSRLQLIKQGMTLSIALRMHIVLIIYHYKAMYIPTKILDRTLPSTI